ncbi:MAG: hypothetical protein ABII90_12760 [Bacteroidota bacterium]
MILLEIYPAREQPIKGIDAKMLLDKIDIINKKMCTKSELTNEIGKNIEVLLTLGAGDIDQLIEPIREALIDKR